MRLRGQAPANPEVQPSLTAGSSTQWVINLYSNRSNSTPVADLFNSQAGGVGHVYSPASSKTKEPSQLNFFFAVSMTVENQEGTERATIDDVYLGQGSEGAGTENNWWIGGAALTYANGSASLAVNWPSGGTASLPVTDAEAIIHSSWPGRRRRLRGPHGRRVKVAEPRRRTLSCDIIFLKI